MVESLVRVAMKICCAAPRHASKQFLVLFRLQPHLEHCPAVLQQLHLHLLLRVLPRVAGTRKSQGRIGIPSGLSRFVLVQMSSLGRMLLVSNMGMPLSITHNLSTAEMPVCDQKLKAGKCRAFPACFSRLRSLHLSTHLKDILLQQR